MSSNISQEKRERAQVIFQNGLGLLQQGKHEEADRLFLEAYLLDPKNVDVLNLLGIRAYQKQEYRNAIDFLNQANQIAPHYAPTLSNLGLVHSALFEYADALQFFNSAIAYDPNIPEAHNNRGNALKGLGKIAEANNAYGKAIALRPNYAEALSNQGVLLLESGQAEKAIALFEKAIAANPQFAIAFNNLGNAFTDLENYEDAFQCFEQALQIYPGYLDACLNFGNCLKKCKQYTAAIDCYQHALKINPENAKTFFLLGEVYYDTGDCDLAKTYYAKSLEICPTDLEAQIALAIAQIPKVLKSAEALRDSRDAFSQQLEFFQKNLHQQSGPIQSDKLIARHPFYLAYQDENNRPLMAKFGEVCTSLAQPMQAKLDSKKEFADANPKIRIGIISSFICSHPVWHAITKGWVNHLDANQFELYIFNTNGVEDQETEKAKSRVALYMNCGTNIMNAAETIADHNLDIILYPEIGMDTVSKALACLRLAPTQIASWGHPETTGLPTIDFYLSSQLMETADSNDYYSEGLITLPSLGTYFEQEVVEAIKPNLQNLGINPNTPILLCAGSPSKYSPAHDHVFVQIAKKLGACQLVFFNFDENLTAILRERLQLVFAREQLDSTQYLHFIPFLNKEEFYGLMHEANLYLDTIGFSGFNTAMQALECDLPIITMAGTKMRGRLASAILNRIGLQELICQSDAAYIDLAVEFIQNRKLLNSIKDKIAQSKVILFNDLEPIRSLEKFLKQQARK